MQRNLASLDLLKEDSLTSRTYYGPKCCNCYQPPTSGHFHKLGTRKCPPKVSEFWQISEVRLHHVHCETKLTAVNYKVIRVAAESR